MCQGADVLAASSASAAVSLGDQAPDAQGQSVYMGSVQCTMTAGNPVTVTINGVPNIQSTNSLSCNAPVTVAGLASLAARYGETVQTARYRKVVTTNFYNRTSVSVTTTGLRGPLVLAHLTLRRIRSARAVACVSSNAPLICSTPASIAAATLGAEITTESTTMAS